MLPDGPATPTRVASVPPVRSILPPLPFRPRQPASGLLMPRDLPGVAAPLSPQPRASRGNRVAVGKAGKAVFGIGAQGLGAGAPHFTGGSRGGRYLGGRQIQGATTLLSQVVRKRRTMPGETRASVLPSSAFPWHLELLTWNFFPPGQAAALGRIGVSTPGTAFSPRKTEGTTPPSGSEL